MGDLATGHMLRHRILRLNGPVGRLSGLKVIVSALVRGLRMSETHRQGSISFFVKIGTIQKHLPSHLLLLVRITEKMLGCLL